MASKTLIIFRLYDRFYGEQGNPKTLSVYLREDNTLGYSLYGGWQDSGTGFAISNLQLQKSLPISPKPFRNSMALFREISNILATGVGSRHIKTFEILNEIKEKKVEKKYDYQVVTRENKWVGGGVKASMKQIKQDIADIKERLKGDGDDDQVVVFYSEKLQQFEV